MAVSTIGAKIYGFHYFFIACLSNVANLITFNSLIQLKLWYPPASVWLNLTYVAPLSNAIGEGMG